MKFLVSILVLALSAQPLAAGYCDMDSAQESPHHSEQANDMDHDCCGSDDSGSQEPCEGQDHCGSCYVNSPALQQNLRFVSAWVGHHYQGLDSGMILPSHSSPPFRPPIS